MKLGVNPSRDFDVGFAWKIFVGGSNLLSQRLSSIRFFEDALHPQISVIEGVD